MKRVFTVLGILVLMNLLLVAAGVAFGVPGLLVVEILFVAWGATLFVFLYYRHLRQEELLHVLITAAESGAPLDATLRAYVDDRPRSELREFFIGTVLFFLLPGYYWFWYRRYNFDAKVDGVADLLEAGTPLSVALRRWPGVATAQTMLAAAVGESTGRLAAALRSAPRHEQSSLWLIVVPRLLYPLLILNVLVNILAFLMIFIVPKFEKIFLDFRLRLPQATDTLIEIGRVMVKHGVLIGAIGGLALIGLLALRPSAWWYCPGIGRLYQMNMQARVLKALGVLLESGMPLPAALDLLNHPDFFPGLVRRRLELLRQSVEQGEALAEPMRRHGLLPRAMVPLVQAAERARHLPWALSELGDHLARRTVRIVHRLSLVLFPVTVFLVGCVVAFAVIALFLPLVHLIERVGQ